MLFVSSLQAIFQISQIIRWFDLMLYVPDNTYGHVGTIRKTYPCNEYPLKQHFYVGKMGYAGVYLVFLFLLGEAVLTCIHNL